MFTAVQEETPTKEKTSKQAPPAHEQMIPKIQSELLSRFPDIKKDSIDAVHLWSDADGTRFRVNVWVHDRIQKSFFTIVDGDAITLR